MYTATTFNIYFTHIDLQRRLDMPIDVEPNLDKPFPEPNSRDEQLETLGDQARVMGNTALLLKELGADIEMTQDDLDQAEEMVKNMQIDGGDKTKEPPKSGQIEARNAAKAPGVALAIGHLVNYYDQQVIQDKVQLRNIAVNKFMELIQSDDEKIQIKAAEMLGKAGDLFTERSEITITHKSSDELKDLIKDRIRTLMQMQAIDVTPKSEKLISELDNAKKDEEA